LEPPGVGLEERAGERRELGAGLLEALLQLLEEALELLLAHLERARGRRGELLDRVGQARGEEVEEGLEGGEVDAALHPGGAQRRPHRLTVGQPDHLERPQHVHALRQRDAQPVLAQQVRELDELRVHQRDPRPCLGSGGTARVWRPASSANVVPRPAKPARQTWTDQKLRDDPLGPTADAPASVTCSGSGKSAAPASPAAARRWHCSPGGISRFFSDPRHRLGSAYWSMSWSLCAW